ncbi:hypothetical protein SynROS8604_03608 [Synechococcus sp. ROS8604]|nr:hypothetical protein SynROS8604_03608 [Synechococcus sp. ROS8604]
MKDKVGAKDIFCCKLVLAIEAAKSSHSKCSQNYRALT